jgi:hypothetical protein
VNSSNPASYSRSTLCPQLQPYMMVVEAWSISYDYA